MKLMEVLLKDGEAFIADRKAKGIDRYDEVHNGLYIAVNYPAGEHQRIVAQLMRTLGDHGMEAFPGVNIGNEDDFRGPDVAAWMEVAPDRIWYQGDAVPPVVIEVLSPSNTASEMTSRRLHYERAGVHIYAEVGLNGRTSVWPLVPDLSETEQTVAALIASQSFASR